MGADIVAVVDDDNIPYGQWGKDLMVGRSVTVDISTPTSRRSIRSARPITGTCGTAGSPCNFSRIATTTAQNRRIMPDIQADLWDGDPDVDALCRMEHAPQCEFDPSCFPLADQALSPCNSQNTFLSARWLKDYFLFPHIGRMDDIWASYYVQAKGAAVVYGKPSVFQDRNVHDLIRDMRQEYLGYENNLRIVNDPATTIECVTGLLSDRCRRRSNSISRVYPGDRERRYTTMKSKRDRRANI